jgi:hypothetical protein
MMSRSSGAARHTWVAVDSRSLDSDSGTKEDSVTTTRPAERAEPPSSLKSGRHLGRHGTGMVKVMPWPQQIGDGTAVIQDSDWNWQKNALKLNATSESADGNLKGLSEARDGASHGDHAIHMSDSDLQVRHTPQSTSSPGTTSSPSAGSGESFRATACSLCYSLGMLVTGAVVGSIGPSVGPLSTAIGLSEDSALFSWVWIARGAGFLAGVGLAAKALAKLPRSGTAPLREP